MGPGQINLIEDTTGKGHITRNLGPEDRVVITVVLRDQRLKGGPVRQTGRSGGLMVHPDH